MTDTEKEEVEISQIKDFVKDGRFDDAVNIIALYIGDAEENEFLDRLENVIETLLTLHGGRTVLRFLIENLVIDIPSLLEHLSKRDPVLRFTFLLLLKAICEKECDLFLPFSENLVNSEDPNVREAALQLLIYMAGGEATIEDESLIKAILMRLNDERDFVVEKALQALKAIGMKSPKLMTKILTDYAKEMADNEEIKDLIDEILRSIVSVDKIEEIVEDEEELSEKQEKESLLEKEESDILDKEYELKKKELEIKKKKLELEEKEKEIEEKVIQKKEEVLKLKEEILQKEDEVEKKKEKKIPKKLKKKEEEIIDKEIELKKKDLEIKKKKLELEKKEKELEEQEIIEKEKALKIKEELIEKEKALSKVELELKQKSIQQKEQKIKEDEMKRVEEELKKVKEKTEDNSD
jgi:hypothetical protein